ncbi:hypothetical protein [Halobaculum limi]|uniref:hypothetical protein n=1 Tax=Halobaculum limi TaxID=3031916 RepID=UPI002406DD52|nr:hypothetical protein [Halobaculum sp. YSMS11]
MIESQWDDIRGKEVRYHDHTWELSGDVEILESGESLGVEARAVDTDRHEPARLFFGLEGTDSLNPGNLATHFDRIEHTNDGHVLVVKTDQNTYRYRLHRLEAE